MGKIKHCRRLVNMLRSGNDDQKITALDEITRLKGWQDTGLKLVPEDEIEVTINRVAGDPVIIISI